MHEPFLLAALEQAKLGRGFCAPNPSVGAIAVQNGTIIAQAWHRGAGTPHAEQLLLAQLPPKMPGVRLYITLEPCNHWGRTPPCVDAIIEYGIEEVFFAYLDPNPLVVQNHSSAKLQAHGVKVTHIPLEAIDAFYRSYAYWTVTRKPRVTVKIAQTLDGKIGRHEERLILSNSLCADLTHQMRAASDIILTSSKTILCDNPRMTARFNGTEQKKPVAILDSQLRLKKEALIFSTASHCHIYHKNEINRPHEVRPYVNSSYYAMPATNEGLDLGAVLSHLGESGYHDVWVEAGGAVFSALHREGLVHRTYLYLVPDSLGERAISAYQQHGLFERRHTISWHEMGDNMVACLDWQED